MEQAKQRVANEKKKQNEKKRKAEKPLRHNPLSTMPKMKAGAIWNDKWTYVNMRGNFRTRADSRTGNGAERNGGRKNCKIIRNWYLLFSTYQILYSFCKMLYNITPVVKYRRFYLLKFPSAALVYALLRSVLNRCPLDI